MMVVLKTDYIRDSRPRPATDVCARGEGRCVCGCHSVSVNGVFAKSL